MVIRHRVREHTRRKRPVRDYVRGSGSRVHHFSGHFEGFRRRFSGASEKARAKVSKRLEEKRAEIAIRNAVREEEQAKETERRKMVRLKRIEEEEALRAREGGYFTRKLKQALKQAREEIKK